MPCGAGLCARREVAQYYLFLHEIGRRAFQFDRSGGALLSGGDNDLAACACDLSLGVGLIASLKLTHLIPPERLTVHYLTRLAEGIHYSSTLLDAERGVQTSERGAVGPACGFPTIDAAEATSPSDLQGRPKWPQSRGSRTRIERCGDRSVG